VSLGECDHHPARIGHGDRKADPVAYRERMPDPVVLDEAVGVDIRSGRARSPVRAVAIP
jgi:hypothetical protein